MTLTLGAYFFFIALILAHLEIDVLLPLASTGSSAARLNPAAT